MYVKTEGKRERERAKLYFMTAYPLLALRGREF